MTASSATGPLYLQVQEVYKEKETQKSGFAIKRQDHVNRRNLSNFDSNSFFWS